jgi:tRNA/rRNA methyltransferase
MALGFLTKGPMALLVPCSAGLLWQVVARREDGRRPALYWWLGLPLALAVGLSARPREYAGRVLSLRDAATEAIHHAHAGDVALVFGTEMSGLSNDELARCGIAATIPANDEFTSLNVAAAVQVAAYELRVASGLAQVWAAPRFTAATHDEIEALHAHVRRTLTAMRFLKPDNPRRMLPRLRRLFGRAALEREEVNILRGILARVDEFVDKAGKR